MSTSPAPKPLQLRYDNECEEQKNHRNLRFGTDLWQRDDKFKSRIIVHEF